MEQKHFMNTEGHKTEHTTINTRGRIHTMIDRRGGAQTMIDKSGGAQTMTDRRGRTLIVEWVEHKQ